MFRYLLTFFILLTVLVRAETTPQQTLDRALASAAAGQPDKAREELLPLVEEGTLSAALCYTMGNLEFRADHSGPAALWYYRALLLDPLQAESHQNLRFLKRRNGFPEGEKWQSEAIIHRWLRPSWMKTTAILCGWLALIAIVWLAWWAPTRGRRWPLVTLLCLLPVPLILSGLGVWASGRIPQPGKIHVVVKKDTVAFASPSEETASAVISLPPGTRVVPLESRGAWRYCELPGGEEGTPLRGWIREDVSEPLWPWDTSRWS